MTVWEEFLDDLGMYKEKEEEEEEVAPEGEKDGDPIAALLDEYTLEEPTLLFESAEDDASSLNTAPIIAETEDNDLNVSPNELTPTDVTPAEVFVKEDLALALAQS